MADREYLDNFEQMLENGLLKVCGIGSMLSSEDITQRWEEFIEDYVSDGVENWNGWPEVTLAWAGYLGVAVAHQWDADWQAHSHDSYRSYYGPKGYDDMDEHIIQHVLGLDLESEAACKITSTLRNCAAAVQALYRHEHIEIQTETGFYILVRSFSVMYRVGAAMELARLGYRNELISGNPSFSVS